MNSLTREGLLDVLALVVLHVSDFAFARTADKDLFLFKGAFLDKYGGCNLRRFLVIVALNNKALRFAPEVNFEV